MSNVKVVIPWRHHPRRIEGLEWVSAYFRHRLGVSCVHIEEDNSDRPFNRAKTINRGVARFPDATIVIADADCVICDYSLRRAIAESSQLDQMLIPHNRFCRTTRQQGNWILRQDPQQKVSGRWFRGNREKGATGGLWVVRAELFLDHRMDERFEGWGSEDTEFLSRIPLARRYNGPLFHIWHPRPSKAHYRRNHRLSWQLQQARK